MALDIYITWYWIFCLGMYVRGFWNIFISCKQYPVLKKYISAAGNRNRFFICVEMTRSILVYQVCNKFGITGFVAHNLVSMWCRYCLCHVASCHVSLSEMLLSLSEAVTYSFAVMENWKTPHTASPMNTKYDIILTAQWIDYMWDISSVRKSLFTLAWFLLLGKKI